jgi:hypothetical protein
MSDQHGLTLSALQDKRFEATKAASEQARTLALAGVGIVWLFAGPFFQSGSGKHPSNVLFFAGGALALALALDLFQLLARALLIERSYNKQEQRADVQAAMLRHEDPGVEDVGSALRIVTRLFFLLKFTSLAAGYVAILVFFAHKI